jgi:dynein heavy chain
MKIGNLFTATIGGGFNARLHLFRRLCNARCLQPDSIIDGFTQLIRDDLGEAFLESETATLPNAFQDSVPTTPIIFILSRGTDKAQDVQKFAAQQGVFEKVMAQSFGQGQSEKAAELIESGRTEGVWVLPQNCHLATSWMPKLEELLQNVHRLTSMPSPHFPVSILFEKATMSGGSRPVPVYVERASAAPPFDVQHSNDRNIQLKYLMEHPELLDQFVEFLDRPKSVSNMPYSFPLLIFASASYEARLEPWDVSLTTMISCDICLS